eukprot:scaffold32775_cov69-Phaeocystis_antarctica.AAC.1
MSTHQTKCHDVIASRQADPDAQTHSHTRLASRSLYGPLHTHRPYTLDASVREPFPLCAPRHPACATQHTAHSTQHTAHSTQHTAHSTAHTPLLAPCT